MQLILELEGEIEQFFMFGGHFEIGKISIQQDVNKLKK